MDFHWTAVMGFIFFFYWPSTTVLSFCVHISMAVWRVKPSVFLCLYIFWILLDLFSFLSNLNALLTLEILIELSICHTKLIIKNNWWYTFRDRCLLAVCTSEGSVKLYRPPFCDFSAEWIEVFPLIRELFGGFNGK